ncbi:MAG: 2-phospho-L-lactate guanylyltransferase [Thermoleophilia bacterium]|nr:2-phospho-L-lactate guanylyltransferase [Thermoleophilia bacterium]
MLAIVPAKGLAQAKTRLAPLLAPVQRAELAAAMLASVLAACREASAVHATLVVTPDPELAPEEETLVDDGRGHAPAIARALADARAARGALVVMADLPLVRAEALDRLAGAARPVALAPARDGGLNALALRRPDAVEPVFGAPGSAALTAERARAAGFAPAVVDDPRLAFDVDRAADLALLATLVAA